MKPMYCCKSHSYPKSSSIDHGHNRCTIWPKGNAYLDFGVNVLLNHTHSDFICEEFVFIDFSRKNIRRFVNDKWITYLSQTGRRLILIVDRGMMALAYYWQSKSVAIATIIKPDDSMIDITKKVNHCHIGHHKYSTKGLRLNNLEVRMLDLLIAEKSVKQIAEILSMKEKRIYENKRILQNKMGGRGIFHTMLSG